MLLLESNLELQSLELRTGPQFAHLENGKEKNKKMALELPLTSGKESLKPCRRQGVPSLIQQPEKAHEPQQRFSTTKNK